MNAPFTENTAEINGINVCYTEGGPQNAIAVIFIHPFGLDHTIWKEQQQFLSENYRVISYDVRGHGQSGIGNGHYFIDLFAEDLIKLMDHLHIEKAVLCGLSMGGYIALRAVSLFPERVLGLMLCDTKSYGDTNEDKIRRFEQIRQIKTNGVLAFAADAGLNLFRKETLENNFEKVSLILEKLEKNNPDALCETLLALASRVDTSEYLKNINVPTLILTGEKDKEILPLDAQYLNHFIAGSSLCSIPDSGHLSNLENPEVFNTTISGFLFTKLTRLTIEDHESVINKG
jgi:3-oxoadipate enol-lactonase